VKVGDLVRVSGDLWSTYTRQGKIGLIIREPTATLSMLVQWEDGVSVFGRPDHLEVISEGR
jgi:hypothetical protein